MTQGPFGAGPLQAKPQPNVYTVLLVIAFLALVVVIVMGAQMLLTPVEDGGYGMTIGELFEAPRDITNSGTQR